jgi:hypothetical protein
MALARVPVHYQGPAGKLPVELIKMCMAPLSQPDVLSAAFVCSQWREVLRSHPQFYYCISVSDEYWDDKGLRLAAEADFDERLSLCTKERIRVAVTLVTEGGLSEQEAIHENYENYRADLDIIDAFRRITLNLANNLGVVYKLDISADNLLAHQLLVPLRASEAPWLEESSVRCSVFSVDLLPQLPVGPFLGHAPRLSKLHAVGFGLGQAPLPAFAHVTELEIFHDEDGDCVDDTKEQFPVNTKTFPRLQGLYLSQLWLRPATPPIEYLELPPTLQRLTTDLLIANRTTPVLPPFSRLGATCAAYLLEILMKEAYRHRCFCRTPRAGSPHRSPTVRPTFINACATQNDGLASSAMTWSKNIPESSRKRFLLLPSAASSSSLWTAQSLPRFSTFAQHSTQLTSTSRRLLHWTQVPTTRCGCPLAHRLSCSRNSSTSPSVMVDAT